MNYPCILKEFPVVLWSTARIKVHSVSARKIDVIYHIDLDTVNIRSKYPLQPSTVF